MLIIPVIKFESLLDIRQAKLHLEKFGAHFLLYDFCQGGAILYPGSKMRRKYSLSWWAAVPRSREGCKVRGIDIVIKTFLLIHHKCIFLALLGGQSGCRPQESKQTEACADVILLGLYLLAAFHLGKRLRARNARTIQEYGAGTLRGVIPIVTGRGITYFRHTLEHHFHYFSAARTLKRRACTFSPSLHTTVNTASAVSWKIDVCVGSRKRPAVAAGAEEKSTKTWFVARIEMRRAFLCGCKHRGPLERPSKLIDIGRKVGEPYRSKKVSFL